MKDAHINASRIADYYFKYTFSFFVVVTVTILRKVRYLCDDFNTSINKSGGRIIDFKVLAYFATRNNFAHLHLRVQAVGYNRAPFSRQTRQALSFRSSRFATLRKPTHSSAMSTNVVASRCEICATASTCNPNTDKHDVHVTEMPH